MVDQGQAHYVYQFSEPTYQNSLAVHGDEIRYVFGTLASGATTTITDRCTGSCGGYIGPDFETAKAVTTLDYFNAVICFRATGGGLEGGRCAVVYADIATGADLSTDGASNSGLGSYLRGAAFGGVAAGGDASDVIVTAFKSKSGDPTRALYCFVTTGSDLYCSVLQKTGDATTSAGLAYENSQRDATTGEATSGVRVNALVATGTASAPTIAALDPYNALVCYLTGAATTACRHLWISGYGSSTYNSPIFDGVASEAAPLNVGSTQSISLGPELVVATGTTEAPFAYSFVTWDVDNEAGYYYKAVVCYTKTDVSPSAGACNMISATPLRKTWSFNAAIDCVNGYGCPTRRSLVGNNATVETPTKKRLVPFVDKTSA
jgi:hypothetical protein